MNDQEFRLLTDRFNGLCTSVQTGFTQVRSDLKYRDKSDSWLRWMFVGVLMLALVSVLVAGYAVSVANTNRNLVVELVRQVNDQARAISQTAQEVKTIKSDPPLPR